VGQIDLDTVELRRGEPARAVAMASSSRSVAKIW
jgi:hypothetical protein